MHIRKTGGTFLEKFLIDMCGAVFHNHHGKPSKEMRTGKTILASHRNPYDFYLSLWSYGIKRMDGNQNGSGWVMLQSKKFNPKFWGKLYSDSSSADNYRLWIKAILSENHSRFYIPYNKFVKKGYGIYTFEVLSTVCDDMRIDRCFVNKWIPMCDMTKETINLIADVRGVGVEDVAAIREKGIIGASYRPVKLPDMLDQESADLIYKYEKPLFDLYGYEKNSWKNI